MGAQDGCVGIESRCQQQREVVTCGLCEVPGLRVVFGARCHHIHQEALQHLAYNHVMEYMQNHACMDYMQNHPHAPLTLTSALYWFFLF